MSYNRRLNPWLKPLSFAEQKALLQTQKASFRRIWLGLNDVSDPLSEIIESGVMEAKDEADAKKLLQRAIYVVDQVDSEWNRDQLLSVEDLPANIPEVQVPTALTMLDARGHAEDILSDMELYIEKYNPFNAPFIGNDQVPPPGKQMAPDMDFMDAYKQNSRISRTKSEKIKRKRIVERRHWKEREKIKSWGRAQAKQVLKDMIKRPQELNRAGHKRILAAYKKMGRTGTPDPFYGQEFYNRTKLDIKREKAADKLRAHHAAEQAYYNQWEDEHDSDDPNTPQPPPAWI